MQAKVEVIAVFGSVGLSRKTVLKRTYFAQCLGTHIHKDLVVGITMEIKNYGNFIKCRILFLNFF